MKQYQAKISTGITSMKLETSLTPSVATPLTVNAAMMNAGSAEAIRNRSTRLG